MVYRTLTLLYQSSYSEIQFHSAPKCGKSKNSHTTSSGAFEGEIHTRAVDPRSEPPAGNAPFNLSVANGAVGGLLFPQQMVSRIRSSLFQVHWVSKWGWGPFLLIWLCMSTATQPRRLRQRICTLIHPVWQYGIRKKGKKVSPCYHPLFIFRYRASELLWYHRQLSSCILGNPIRVPSKGLGAYNRKS